MSAAVFVKTYADPAAANAARAHLDWFSRLGADVRLPQVRGLAGGRLKMERLPGRGPVVADLVRLAGALGCLHGVAYVRELHSAGLDAPFTTSTGLVIPGFRTGRERWLDVSDDALSEQPAALYKDANLRNFVIDADEVGLVDFDDLTLAPFGYDLAKLVVSVVMTYGRISGNLIEAARTEYNDAVATAGGMSDACSEASLVRHAELHGLMTAAYLGRNGYRHPWPATRPWTRPDPPAGR